MKRVIFFILLFLPCTAFGQTTFDIPPSGTVGVFLVAASSENATHFNVAVDPDEATVPYQVVNFTDGTSAIFLANVTNVSQGNHNASVEACNENGWMGPECAEPINFQFSRPDLPTIHGIELRLGTIQ